MSKVMAHADGGTVTTIALHSTRAGWAIAVTRWTTYRNVNLFEVLRVSPDNRTVRLALNDNEAAARVNANTAWSLDR